MTVANFEREAIDPQWLRSALATRGVTQAGLARALGVDVSTVAKWLNGTRALRKTAWIAVLTTLELPQDWSPPKPEW